jgi:hypothetical protein
VLLQRHLKAAAAQVCCMLTALLAVPRQKPLVRLNHTLNGAAFRFLWLLCWLVNHAGVQGCLQPTKQNALQ